MDERRFGVLDESGCVGAVKATGLYICTAESRLGSLVMALPVFVESTSTSILVLSVYVLKRKLSPTSPLSQRQRSQLKSTLPKRSNATKQASNHPANQASRLQTKPNPSKVQANAPTRKIPFPLSATPKRSMRCGWVPKGVP